MFELFIVFVSWWVISVKVFFFVNSLSVAVRALLLAENESTSCEVPVIVKHVSEV